MKSPRIPASSLSPAERNVAGDSLREGECTPSVDAQLERAQQAFIERSLASRAQARSDGVYFSSMTVLPKLQSRLANAKNNPQ